MAGRSPLGACLEGAAGTLQVAVAEIEANIVDRIEGDRRLSGGAGVGAELVGRNALQRYTAKV